MIDRIGTKRAPWLIISAFILSLICLDPTQAQIMVDEQGLPTTGNSNQSRSGDATIGTPNLAEVSPVFAIDGAGEDDQGEKGGDQSRPAAARDAAAERRAARPLAEPGQFEAFVEQALGRPLPRFGASLLIEERGFAISPTATVPPDYILNPGDTLFVGLTGSVEGNLELTVGNDGRVFLPRIGAISVAGIRYGDVSNLLAKHLGRQFRDFNVAVTAGELHGIRVYVTGYAVTPGAYTVSSLSTLVNAVLAAGGPSAAGSFRAITLRRNGQVVTQFDLYDLLLSGDKSRDAVLQNEDVIHIGPVGAEMAVFGAVNAEAIYETKPGETLADLLRYAGGLNSVADDSRVLISRLSNLDLMGWQELSMSAAQAAPIERGSIVRILSSVDYARPLGRQAIVATIEGEVNRPGRYYLEPGSTMADLLAQAGNLSPRAFIFGTQLDRSSVRRQQQASFDRAISDLELALAVMPLSDPRGETSMVIRLQAAQAIIKELETRKPDGRLVLSLEPDTTALPADFVLENDDRIFIPPRPTTIGVFGAVYQPGSFVFKSASTVGDYLKLAGGPRKMADRSDIFVVRANGAVVSMHQSRGWSSDILGKPALPGDVVFVPVKTHQGQLFDRIKDVAQVLYQMGLGAAALKVLGD